MTCLSCHPPHHGRGRPGALKAETEAETCFACHAGVRSRTLRTSRHPVRDGVSTCSSCHAPHGTANEAMLPKPTATETCVQCHAEKRGPFLWEHAPAREDCTLCHDSHGSSHRPLLVSRVPYLCQRCHLNVQHPSKLFDLSNTGGGGIARARPSRPARAATAPSTGRTTRPARTWSADVRGPVLVLVLVVLVLVPVPVRAGTHDLLSLPSRRQTRSLLASSASPAIASSPSSSNTATSRRA